MVGVSRSPPATKPRCLRGFSHINRFWDNNKKLFVAKILPGEFYVTREHEAVATTLGSCVSACIWDEGAGIGGMNHFMLPITDKRSADVIWGNVSSDATRYGNYAMEHLINEILKNGGERSKLKAKVFGGGKILQQMNDVGSGNASFVVDYLRTENIPLVAQDLNGYQPRKVYFEPFSGRVMIKKLRKLHNDTICDRETHYQDSILEESLEGDIELFE